MMITKLIVNEIKNIVRDRLMIFILVYPIIIGVVGRSLLAMDDFDAMGVDIVSVVAVVISGFLFGAIAGFSILDDRDDHIFTSISITPLSIKMYVWVKIIFIYLLSIASSLLVYVLVGLTTLTWMQILVLALVSGLQVPLHALIINAFSSNKVEGFVIMKASGFLLIFPIIGYIFVDAKQWLFSIAPAFWVVKATQSLLLTDAIEAGIVDLGLNFVGFLSVGVVFSVVLIVVFTLKFNHKIFQ